MPEVFVHEAWLTLHEGADPRAPGAAVTAGLCGHWEHEGPCRWPHLSIVRERSGQAIHLRILFVADPGEEQAVRRRIGGALLPGRLTGPDGESRWTLASDGASSVLPDEETSAGRLSLAPLRDPPG